jgi:hypothetical protein
VLEGVPFQVGGGWHLASTAEQPRGTKRASDSLDDGSLKRPCIAATDTDTATEPETDDEAQPSLARTTGRSLPVASDSSSEPPRPPQQGTQAPVDHDAEAAGETAIHPGDLEEVPETIPNTPNATQRQLALKGPNPNSSHTHSSTQKTYKGTRTHIPTSTDLVGTADGSESPACPNSPSLTAAELIRRERARAIAAKLHAELNNRLNERPRSRRLFSQASRPPIVQPQARPAPGASGNPIEARTRGPHPLDPVSRARADMIAFNEEVAQGNATSLVGGVTCQSKHQARCEPPASRPLDELLDDNEEAMAQAEAYANKRWPVSNFYLLHICFYSY